MSVIVTRVSVYCIVYTCCALLLQARVKVAAEALTE